MLCYLSPITTNAYYSFYSGSVNCSLPGEIMESLSDHVSQFSSLYGYTPTTWICILFVVLHSFSTLVHLAQATRSPPLCSAAFSRSLVGRGNYGVRMTRESVRSLLVMNEKWFINSLTGSQPPLSYLHSSLRPFKSLRTIDVSTSRGKCRKYVCRCQMGHPRGPVMEGGREQMKDKLNETLSARMCIWGEG